MKDERKTKKELINELKKLRSETKKTEIELRESEERYLTSIEHANDGFIFVEDGKIIFSNQKFLDILGYDDFKDVRNKQFTMFLDPEDRTTFMDIYKRRLKGEPAPSRYECKGIKKNGQQINVEISSAISTFKGNPVTLAFVHDITERKLKDEAVRKSEAQLLATINCLPFDFFAIDTDGRYFLQNNYCTENWGNVIGKRPEDLGVPKETLDLWLDNNRRAFSGETITGEVTFYIKGEKKHYHNIISPILYQNEILGILGLNVDISDRKLLEEELLAKDARQTALLQSLPMAFYVAQPFGNYGGTWVSDQIDTISGFTPEQFMEDRNLWESRLHDDDRERILEEYGQITTSGTVTLEYRWKTANGTYKWFLDSAVLVRDEKGNPKEVIGSWLDITERKHAEDALRKGEEKLKTLFDSATDAIFILDMKGNFININRTAHERLGYTREEMLAMSISELNHPDLVPKVPERLDQIRKGGFAIFESAHTRKDGTIMPVEVNSRILDYDGRKVFFSFIRDITERKKADNDLKISCKNLEDEKARTEAIIAAMGDGISIQDTDFKILYQNDVHKGFTGSHVGKYCY
ncbi:MAG: PAS domain S-box protein, partial [Thermodesulfovibrionales bacterium]